MTPLRKILFATGLTVVAAVPALSQQSGADSGVTSLLEVRRVYVAQLVGGVQADVLRELIIASIDGTKLFVLTDNPDRADAILKGAADDKAYTDSVDVDENASTRQNSRYTSGTGSLFKSGSMPGQSVGDNESLHSRERKHEAYASVRLCSKDGDVLWSTTQESGGAKFHGAGADVAMKIAHQLTLDFDKTRRSAALAATGDRQ